MQLYSLRNAFVAGFSRRKLLRYIDKYFTRIVIAFVWYGVLWTILGDDAFPKEYVSSQDWPDDEKENISFNLSSYAGNDSLLVMESRFLDIPDGHFFAVFILLVFSAFFGFLTRLVFLPPLTGMLIAGFILRNISRISFAADINPIWSSTIRNICLVVVLIRGGLSLDSRQLKRLKLAVPLLALLPCISEGGVDGVVATFFLPLPWKWGLMLGYILAAISPAVVIPTMLQLQCKKYGVVKGIPTLIVAAASVDVVTSVSLFGVFLGLVFSEGNLVLDIFRAPIQISLGLIYGVMFGSLLWILPSKNSSGNKLRNRFFLLLGLGLFGLLGSRRAVIGGSSLAGAGALSILVLSFVAGIGWTDTEKELLNRTFFILWKFLEPLLFGLIGAEVNIEFITASLIGKGLLVIVSGLIIRVIISIIAVSGNGFNVKEKILIAIAWIPKATVQAAVGSFALDIAVANNLGQDIENMARTVLTVAVLSIVLTAPSGAVAIKLLGPCLLKRQTTDEEDSPADEHPVDGELKGGQSTENEQCQLEQELHKETQV